MKGGARGRHDALLAWTPVAALVAVAWGAFITRYGIAVSVDSATYLGVARNIQHGDGVRLAFDEPGKWLDVFPPGLPLLLAASRGLGIGLLDWGRVATIGLLAVNAVLVVSITRQLAPRPRVLAPLAGALFLLARGTVEAHATLLSEPLYLASELTAILVLLRRTASRRPQLLLALAALAAGMGLLARFAGLATIAACGLWLLVAERGPALRRVVSAGVFGVVAAVPFGVWVLVSANVDESVNRRGAALHPATVKHVRRALGAFSEWLLPARGGPFVTGLSLLLVAAVVGLVSWRALRSLGRGRRPSPLLLLLLVAAGHVALVVFTIFFVAEGNYLDRRSLLPSYAAMLPAGVAVVAELVAPPALPRRVVLAGTTGLVLAAVVLQVPVVARQDREDLGWASASWQGNAVVERVRDLPAGSVVYSNIPSLLWFTTGFEVRRFPGTDVRGGENGRADSAQIRELTAELRRCGGAAVAFEQEVVHAGTDAANNRAILDAVGGDPVEYDDAAVVVVDGARRCTPGGPVAGPLALSRQ